MPLQDTPKFIQIWIFGLKKCIPSGNPAFEDECLSFDQRSSQDETIRTKLKPLKAFLHCLRRCTQGVALWLPFLTGTVGLGFESRHSAAK
jgi:hypothetical protein